MSDLSPEKISEILKDVPDEYVESFRKQFEHALRLQKICKKYGSDCDAVGVLNVLQKRNYELTLKINQLHAVINDYPDIANEFYRGQTVVPYFAGKDAAQFDFSNKAINALADLGIDVAVPAQIRRDSRTERLLEACHDLVKTIEFCHKRFKADYLHGEDISMLHEDEKTGLGLEFPEFLISSFKDNDFQGTEEDFCKVFVCLLQNKDEVFGSPAFVYLAEPIAVLYKSIESSLERLEEKRKDQKIEGLERQAYRNATDDSVLATKIEEVYKEPPSYSNLLDCVEKKAAPQLRKILAAQSK